MYITLIYKAKVVPLCTLHVQVAQELIAARVTAAAQKMLSGSGDDAATPWDGAPFR